MNHEDPSNTPIAKATYSVLSMAVLAAAANPSSAMTSVAQVSLKVAASQAVELTDTELNSVAHAILESHGYKIRGDIDATFHLESNEIDFTCFDCILLDRPRLLGANPPNIVDDRGV